MSKKINKIVLSQLDSHTEKIKLNSFLTPYTEGITRCLVDLNVKGQTLRHVEDKIGNDLLDFGIG